MICFQFITHKMCLELPERSSRNINKKILEVQWAAYNKVLFYGN